MPDTSSDGAMEDCDWCHRRTLVHVGIYIDTPERCTALDIKDKNVLKINAREWAVRPDWGKELDLPLKQYMVFCPHCNPSCHLRGCMNAVR